MILKKKAQISISFNWIFVMVVGAVFLIFFFTLISTQSKTTEQKVSATVAKQFETILGTTTQKAGTFKTYRTSPIKLNFYCNASEPISYYSVEDLQAGETSHEVLFSPSQIQGNQLYTWTQEWSYPYSIMNFLYVTNKFNMFIFYDSKDSTMLKVNTLKENLPDNLTTYTMNDTHFPSSLLNNDRYVYILFKEQLPKLDSAISRNSIELIKEKSSFLIIDSSEDVFTSGGIYFTSGKDYDYVEDNINLKLLDLDNHKSDYYGDASLFGALFSADKGNYDCNMVKAFKRLKMINKLYLYRVNNTIPVISESTNCYFLYAGSSLRDGLQGSLTKYVDLLDLGFLNVEKDDVLRLSRSIQSLNYDVSYESQCPNLY